MTRTEACQRARATVEDMVDRAIERFFYDRDYDPAIEAAMRLEMAPWKAEQFAEIKRRMDALSMLH